MIGALVAGLGALSFVGMYIAIKLICPREEPLKIHANDFDDCEKVMQELDSILNLNKIDKHG